MYTLSKSENLNQNLNHICLWICARNHPSTRICDTISTLIDNVYTNVIDKTHISGILLSPLSDQ